MSILKSKKSAFLAGIVAIGILAAGTTAYALFSISGSASASVPSGSASNLTYVSAAINYAGSESSLWPNVQSDGGVTTDHPEWGAHLASVVISAHNPNDDGVRVNGSDITMTLTDGSACDPFVKVLNPLTVDGGTVYIGPKSDGSITVHSLYLDPSAPQVCAGQTFNITWNITAQAA